jgi:peptidoglycan/xylan/chitin deacetylase (PgdA/CDA1 family)
MMRRNVPVTTRLLWLGAAFCCALVVVVLPGRAGQVVEEYHREWAQVPYDPELAVLYHGDTEKMEVCLTIDDGPNPDTTRGLLYILRKKGVRATFFLLGRRAEEHPDLVRAIVADGHEVGNHTMEHNRLSGLEPQEIMNELELGRDAIQRAAEVRVTLFRPPGGSMTEDVYRVAGELGYTTVLWTDTANDWYRQPPSHIVERIVSRVRPGSIIVIHDGKPDILDALPKIIDALRERGYTFKMAGEWAMQCKYASAGAVGGCD